MTIGVYPTPVELLTRLSSSVSALWVKRDDLTNPRYGGNKVRKVERLLADAQQKGKKEIVTIGAVGSNHVLTTGVFAADLGMHVSAVLVRQPSSAHVLENLRADLAQGIELIPASSYAAAALRVATRIARGAYYIPAGGSNPIGAAGFVAAALELAEQVRSGQLPEPDLIVVPLGSGGTTAGLVAGLAQTDLRSRVLAVTVAQPEWLVERQARSLAKACANRKSHGELLGRLEHTRAYIGGGYGVETEQGARATAVAAEAGIKLEQTYTAKAFAAALDRVAAGRDRTILYWHTLSSAPMVPLLVGAPNVDALDRRLLMLVRT